LGISGTVSADPTGRPPVTFFLQRSDAGTFDFKRDQSVNGSVTSVEFTLKNNSTFDPTRAFQVRQIRIHAVAGAIQIGKWIEVPALTNGFLVEITSAGSLSFSENLKLTEDIFQRFSIGRSSKYDIISEGKDALVATFENDFKIEESNDDITALVRDNLSSAAITRHEIEILGFYLS